MGSRLIELIQAKTKWDEARKQWDDAAKRAEAEIMLNDFMPRVVLDPDGMAYVVQRVSIGSTEKSVLTVTLGIVYNPHSETWTKSA